MMLFVCTGVVRRGILVKAVCRRGLINLMTMSLRSGVAGVDVP